MYIQGVGTSGFRPFAMVDAATGVGVPSNVRKLYRFLCWNWRPGVEIYMFGFSRGAFTIRTLIGLIASRVSSQPKSLALKISRRDEAQCQGGLASVSRRKGDLAQQFPHHPDRPHHP